MGILSKDAVSDVQDFIIIGAGISGINAAYRFQTEFPNANYLILERRDEIGGTWDLFRYPGIRSDSDLYTFSFQWRPWTHPKAIARGDLIREYMVDAAHDTGIDKHIRFRHELTRASWSTEKQLWTLSCVADGSETFLYSRFVYWGSGYYDYKKPLSSPIPGIENFSGSVIHPQFWPKDLDYAGKNVAIIGSGATAVTLLPALAEKAKRVTMVQRTPTYIVSRPSVDPNATFWLRWLPTWIASTIIRLRILIRSRYLFNYTRANPDRVREAIKKVTIAQLPPDIPFEPHFIPPYNPWDQRLCLSPDGDFFQALRSGKGGIATGVIETCTPSGIRLVSGQTVDADIIITATGLQLQLGGGSQIFVDGTEIRVGDKFYWRGMMLQDIPNAGFSAGYANASWTLGADTSARLFAKVMRDVRRGGYASVVPRVPEGAENMTPTTTLNLRSTYIRRSAHLMPKVGDHGPWAARKSHLHEVFKLMFLGRREGLVFTTA